MGPFMTISFCEGYGDKPQCTLYKEYDPKDVKAFLTEVLEIISSIPKQDPGTMGANFICTMYLAGYSDMAIMSPGAVGDINISHCWDTRGTLHSRGTDFISITDHNGKSLKGVF